MPRRHRRGFTGDVEALSGQTSWLGSEVAGTRAMAENSNRRHRFPPVVIQHAVWLYLRFTLSYRDVEDLLAERGLDISYETVWSWVLKFGPVIARRLRRHRPRPSDRWHLDEMVVRIAELSVKRR